MLAIETGLRENEIATLQLADVLSLRTGRCKKTFLHHNAKAKSQIKVTLSKLAQSIIEKYIKYAKPYLFRSRDKKNKPVKAKTLYRAWVRLQRKIYGVEKYSFHDFRRYSVTKKYHEKGMAAAKKFARHRDSKTTLIYIMEEK